MTAPADGVNRLATPTVRNRLLSALLRGAYNHLATKLERVTLTLGTVLYQPDLPIEYVYFPEDAVVSLLAVMVDGDTCEVGLIGKEGMLGIQVFLGATTQPETAIVQIAGTAMRMKADSLRQELRLGSPLQQLLLRYTQTLLAVIRQSAACNGRHTVEQRLARWLLQMYDYVGTETLQFTHEFLSMMVGNRRASVTVAARHLQAIGVITYEPGRITLLDRLGLEAAACECYGKIHREDEAFHADIPGLLASL